ncbi:type I secretion system permease/ATPase [Rhizobium sp. SL42]|uniref:type I secretion system permease/ATPase n=1 Tax=Rhizobium sp. SL42 TaxID=2806346 RepID=UPI001F28D1A9|nr:type I secretion system permease/ATPase [Rhizobium sp. SL42]UJW77082.1 type I secretion system permease/ATPase [Rhizobium sp. SL42]
MQTANRTEHAPAGKALKINGPLAAIALLSGVTNILALTSPLFMLQVYDRVLSSGSIPTLVGLAVLAASLYAFQALLDIIRARVLLRIGEKFDHRLSPRVYHAVVRLPLLTRMPGDGLQPLRDLDNVRGFLSGSGPTAFFDLPWMPLYLGISFLFHVWIGVTALAGAIMLVSLTILTNLMSRRPIREATAANMARNGLLEATRRNAEIVHAMGLGSRTALRWQQANLDYLHANRQSGDVMNGLGNLSRALRMMLQSALLGVGAWLVISQEATGGVMIASSIMMGRALAPVDAAITAWKPYLMARQSWTRLQELLARVPLDPPVLSLPRPQSDLRVDALAVAPPGEKIPTLAGIAFAIQAGNALGIIGPSGSGKSTLARALVGAWPPLAGKVRIDGASLDQWNREELGPHIGYLPQGVELFDGTIAENIARLEAQPNSEAIVAAARTAGAHEMILRMEHGYDTRIGEGGSALSAGQRQRIGLARALYNDPFLVILDEPNANLDAEGEAAVVKAIASVRARKGIAVVVAHRPSAIGAVDFILMVEAGRQKAFGPREKVLAEVLQALPPAVRPYQPAPYGISPLRVVASPGSALQAEHTYPTAKQGDADVTP